MVTYLGGSILITIFALGGSILSYNLQEIKNIEVEIDNLLTDNPHLKSQAG